MPELSEAKSKETVDHPNYYTCGNFECIDVIEELELGYSEGCAFKYIWRAGKKIDYPDDPMRDRVEDLRKAAWYLNYKAGWLERKAKADTQIEDLLFETDPSVETDNVFHGDELFNGIYTDMDSMLE